MHHASHWMFVLPAIREVNADREREKKSAEEEMVPASDEALAIPVPRSNRSSRMPRSGSGGTQYGVGISEDAWSVKGGVNSVAGTVGSWGGHSGGFDNGVNWPSIAVAAMQQDRNTLPAVITDRPYSSALVRQYVSDGLSRQALEEILGTMEGSEAFGDFLRSEHAEESIAFLRYVGAFEAQARPFIDGVCHRAADYICREFLHDTASEQVNLLSATSARIMLRVEGLTTGPGMFKEAACEILRQLGDGAFLRWSETPEFAQLLERLAAFERAGKLQASADLGRMSTAVVESQLKAERDRMALNTRVYAQTTKKQVTMVIIGTGHTGKSTLVRRMRLRCGEPFNQAERVAWAGRIVDAYARDLAHAVGSALEKVTVSGTPAFSADVVGMLSMTGQMTREGIAALCRDVIVAREGFREWMLAHIPGSQRSLHEKFFYSEEAIARMLADDFNSASDEDICNTPASTLGVAAYEFSSAKCQLRIIDCGGQRSQRRKWLKYFDSATAVVFVSNLDDYWRPAAEGDAPNALMESLEVFEETVNAGALHNCPVLLFLNKTDLLPGALARYPFNEYFPDFKGDCLEPKAVIKYVGSLFEARNNVPLRQRPVRVLATQLGDASQVTSILQAIEEQGVLSASGLLQKQTV